LLALPLPFEAHANPATIHVVRFIGGIIYDVAVGVVADLIVDKIRSSSSSGYDARVAAQQSYQSYQNLPVKETSFSHPTYKRAVVRLGLSEGQLHPTRQIALNLRDPMQLERFGKLEDYLVQNKIRVKLANYAYSHEIKPDVSPDDLFTLDYLDMGKHEERHYQEIITLTENTVFEKLAKG
jgi:hypothetical protein